jgi:hypothetical protein
VDRVLDPRGEIMGKVTLPANVTPLSVSGARMWGFERDENDVQSVVRFRITP